jgi:protein-tyrosine phosphatase
MDDRAAAVLARNGYDGSSHRARVFDGFTDRDLVLAMDSGHLAILRRQGGSNLAVPVELFADADVPDPYYGDDTGFEDVLDQIEKAADNWVDRLAR